MDLINEWSDLLVKVLRQVMCHGATHTHNGAEWGIFFVLMEFWETIKVTIIEITGTH